MNIHDALLHPLVLSGVKWVRPDTWYGKAVSSALGKYYVSPAENGEAAQEYRPGVEDVLHSWALIQPTEVVREHSGLKPKVVMIKEKAP